MVVPSLPGGVTYGDTIEKAIEVVREAIESHIESLKKHGEEIPKRGRNFRVYALALMPMPKLPSFTSQ
ncbi:MAG: type II toxin-antitoxin system HicB family antitoxin [Candidatus Zixiibacteriota bacterium]